MTQELLPSFSPTAQSLKKGLYEHYRGGRYEVISIARHSETLEELVVYRALYGDQGYWVRPLQMFCEEVLIDSRKVARFRYVGPL
jgi:cyclomaltodextrinase